MPTCRRWKTLQTPLRASAFPPLIRPAASLCGKGQAIIREGDDPAHVWKTSAQSAIREASFPSRARLPGSPSRSRPVRSNCYDVTEKEHRDHILKTSNWRPPRSSGRSRQNARRSQRNRDALDYVGLLAV